jgi:spermidine synthase
MKEGNVVLTERDFFGIKRVVKDEKMVLMTHGSTLHGLEYIDPRRRDEPTYYYSFDSGVGMLLRNFPRTHDRGLRVGVVGLGIGTLAAFGKPGDVYRFYEIDPQVLKLAQGQNTYFHYLQDSQANLEFVEGDARISLEDEARKHFYQRFDVLILDAFSGDSVPMHLLTREAMRGYLEHLRDSNSVIAVHITNRYIDLKPVLTALAQSYHLQIAYLPARDSHWVLLSEGHAVLAIPEIKSATFNTFLDQKPVLWTDDYSNLLKLM